MVNESITCTELPGLGLLRLSGEQSAALLQGQLTCNVEEVTAQQSRLGALCNPKGRVLANFRLFYHSSNYYLLLPQTMLSLLIADLQKYSVLYKATLEDNSYAWHKLGLTGLALKRYLPQIVFEKMGVYPLEGKLILAVPGVIPRIIVLSTSPINVKQFISIPITIKDFSYWQSLDIESGIATIYPSTRELFTPHHIHFHHQGVSFNKGCYTGQEVIARMHYLGKLKNQLYKLVVNHTSLPEPGTPITDQLGNIQGNIVLATPISDTTQQNTYQALATLKSNATTQIVYFMNTPIQTIEEIPSH